MEDFLYYFIIFKCFSKKANTRCCGFLPQLWGNRQRTGQFFYRCFISDYKIVFIIVII